MVDNGDKSTQTESEFIKNDVEQFKLSKKDGSVDELVNKVPVRSGCARSSEKSSNSTHP